MTQIDDTTEEATEVIPEIGLRRDVENKVYRAWKAASNSDLSIIKNFSPMHMHYKRTNPPEPTPALAFGSALHTAVLEPHKFSEEYVVAGQCNALVKSTGRPCQNDGSVLCGSHWYCRTKGHAPGPDESGELKVITQDDKEKINNIVQAISFHPAARGLIESPGDNELSAVFNHAENGQLCKLRADMWRPEWEAIVDVKTTENASREEFERSLTDYGYHRQAAFYLDGLNANGIPAKYFALIVVEKSAPYGVAVYRLMEDAIDAGREQLKRLVRIYKNCADNEANLIRQGKSGASAYYGYESQLQDISITQWEMRKIIRGEQ